MRYAGARYARKRYAPVPLPTYIAGSGSYSFIGEGFLDEIIGAGSGSYAFTGSGSIRLLHAASSGVVDIYFSMVGRLSNQEDTAAAPAAVVERPIKISRMAMRTPIVHNGVPYHPNGIIEVRTNMTVSSVSALEPIFNPDASDPGDIHGDGSITANYHWVAEDLAGTYAPGARVLGWTDRIVGQQFVSVNDSTAASYEQITMPLKAGGGRTYDFVHMWSKYKQQMTTTFPATAKPHTIFIVAWVTAPHQDYAKFGLRTTSLLQGSLLYRVSNKSAGNWEMSGGVKIQGNFNHHHEGPKVFAGRWHDVGSDGVAIIKDNVSRQGMQGQIGTGELSNITLGGDAGGLHVYSIMEIIVYNDPLMVKDMEKVIDTLRAKYKLAELKYG